MKTQIVFTCCRCGKEQVNDLNWFSAHKFKYRIFTHRIRGGEVPNKKELCNDCYHSLLIWLQNGDEYKELIEENKQLKKQKDWLEKQRMNVCDELDTLTKEYETCKDFCPRNSSDWNEYCEWYKEKHKDDIQ